MFKKQRGKQQLKKMPHTITTPSQDMMRTFFEMTARIPDAKAAILYISRLEKKQQELKISGDFRDGRIDDLP